MSEKKTHLSQPQPQLQLQHKMVGETKFLRLMGSTIRVSERYEGEFESEKRFIETNKHLFKYRGGVVEIDQEAQRMQYPTLKLPGIVISSIVSKGGGNMEFLMGKKLEESDINKNQNRFYVPKKTALLANLTQNEIETIEGGGLEVKAIDTRARAFTLRMKIWAGSLNKYVLIKEWGKLVSTNSLQKSDFVEIWSYRVDSVLHLFVNNNANAY